MSKDIIMLVLVAIIMIAAIAIMKRRDKKNLDTDEHADAKSKRENKSILAAIIKSIGVISIIAGIIVFVYSIDIALVSVISGIIFFALAELVRNSQLQTQLLKKILNERE
ncbi:MAG: hypothetical protein HYS25_13615 [Ignavibacteriales bacterium]|nr:hypothetical protein [Ignavibacteriales bacterium]